MKFTGRAFNISYQNQATKVEVYTIDRREVLKVHLPEPLFITKIKDKDKYDVWTSLPQGKQKLAEDIGELVDKVDVKEGRQSNNGTQSTLF